MLSAPAQAGRRVSLRSTDRWLSRRTNAAMIRLPGRLETRART